MEKVKRMGIWADIIDSLASFFRNEKNREHRESLDDISENYCKSVNVSKAEMKTLRESLAKLAKNGEKEEKDPVIEKYGPVENSAIRKVAEKMNALEEKRKNNDSTEIGDSDNSHDYR